MTAGAPIGNTNAEKWTFEEAQNFLFTAYDMAKRKCDYNVNGKTVKGFEYDFLGEIASELDSYKEIFTYLTDKFNELQPLYNKLLGRLESNCFSNSKKGIIKEATAIVNLKSNYKWTDRNEQTNKGDITLHFDKDDKDA